MMYFYYGRNGQEFVTPNRDLAFGRAAFHGSDVFTIEENSQEE